MFNKRIRKTGENLNWNPTLHYRKLNLRWSRNLDISGQSKSMKNDVVKYLWDLKTITMRYNANGILDLWMRKF